MNYESRRAALSALPPEVWSVDDWLRQRCAPVGLVLFSLVDLYADTGVEPAAALTALFVLADAGLVVWDQEELLVYVVGWALDLARPDAVTQLAWALQVEKWPETAPVLALRAELEEVKRRARPPEPALQLVADDGRTVNGPKRACGGR